MSKLLQYILAARRRDAAGGGASGLSNPPTGFAYVVDADGAYVVNADGAYMLGKVA